MHYRQFEHLTPMQSPTGEIIHEFGGQAAGGLTQHSLAHIRLPVGAYSPKHYHPLAEESYYILQGVARVVIAGESQIVKAGEMVGIPAQQVHQIFNDGTEDVIFLAVCVPAWTPDCSVFLDDEG